MPKILIWDVETAPIVATTWSLWPKAIPHGAVLRDSYLLCGAWKWHGEDEVHHVACDPDHVHDYFYHVTDEMPDRNVTEELRAAVLEADWIVAHNGDKFDSRKLGARIIEHGLDPLPVVRSVDTLKEVRKVAMFSSNRLDFLTRKMLDDGGKIDTNYDLWQRCMRGEAEAMQEMVTYCRNDVTELERFYDYLMPYMRSHPNQNAGNGPLGVGESHTCPKCGSDDVQKRGYYHTQTQRYQRYRCNNCRSWSRDSRAKGGGILKTPS